MIAVKSKKAPAMILVVVLWIMVAVSTLTLAMAISARGQMRGHMSDSDSLSVELALRSALNRAQAIALADTTNYDCADDIWAVPHQGNFSLEVNEILANIYAVHADGTVDWGLTDLASKINANTASIEVLARLPGMDDQIAENFVQLRQQLLSASGKLPRGRTGAISSYMQLARMLASAMGQPQDLSHDLEVMSPDERFLNPLDLPDDVQAVLNCLCIDSFDANTQLDGSDRVNINTASEIELTAALSDVLDAAKIQAIALAAADSEFSDPAELLARQLYYLDQYDQPHITALLPEEFKNISDRLSCSDESYFDGLVNINTAGEDILLALSGLDDANVQQIISYREDNPHNIASKSWLLGILPTSLYVELSPLVTTRSQQFEARIVIGGSFSPNALYARCVFSRQRGQSSVISVERYNGIWHDPR